VFPRMHGIVSQAGGTGGVPPEPGFSPDDITGLALWLDADDESTITESIGAVSSWTSKDANARTFSQATGSLQPTTNASTQNSLNVIDFAGDYLVCDQANSIWTFMHNGTTHYVFAIVKVGVVADPNAAYALFGNDGDSISDVGMNFRFDDRDSLSRNERVLHLVHLGPGGNRSVLNVSGDGFLPPNQFVLFQAASDPDNGTAAARSSMSVDNGTAVENNAQTNAPSTSAPTYALSIGSASNGVFPFTGSFAELLVYEANLSGTDIANIQTYLADKWDVTLA
jgi:hypothetical protein